MPIELGSFSFGAVVGGAIVAVFNHFLAKSRTAEERQIMIHNERAELLINALIETQQKITSIDSVLNIIKKDFPIHDGLKRRFILSINSSDSGFTKAWNDYQYWYEKVACQGTTDKLFPEHNPLKNDLGYQETLKAAPDKLIQAIIETIKHK